MNIEFNSLFDKYQPKTWDELKNPSPKENKIAYEPLTMEKLESTLKELFDKPIERKYTLFTARGGLEMFNKAMQKEAEKYLKENLENTD